MSSTARTFSAYWRTGTASGKAPNPAWELMKEKIESACLLDGFFLLDVVPMPDFGPTRLNVQCERGYFFISLVENTIDDCQVRTYFDPTASTNPVQIGIDTWNERVVIRDPKIVIAIFKEFFDTGNVSTDLLSV
jgi:hypothetical protein